MFKVLKKSKISNARLTRLVTPHGEIAGPFFMPIATRGAVKNLTTDELLQIGAQILLSNTYHLFLRPGLAALKKAGGLHNFMNWQGPILTDSGGYQVFSLNQHLKIFERGCVFADPASGQKVELTPESVIKIQKIIGSDLLMVLDVCSPYPASKKQIDRALNLTGKWAEKSLKSFSREFDLSKKIRPQLLGIIQGGVYKDLRIKSAKEITALPLDGFAIGGVAVGEPRKYLKSVLEWVMPELPENKPRYLMGLGKPEELVEAVKQGIDMFDCVIPTREARHGRLYLWNKESRIKNQGRSNFYQSIQITNAKFKGDTSPVNQTNLKQYSRAYLHHLFKTNEPLGMRLATLNNLDFYLKLMEEIRQIIKVGKL